MKLVKPFHQWVYKFIHLLKVGQQAQPSFRLNSALREQPHQCDAALQLLSQGNCLEFGPSLACKSSRLVSFASTRRPRL